MTAKPHTVDEATIWLSVIIPVHNEGQELLRHLKELDCVLHRLAPKQCEVIIVDDASTDRCLENWTTNSVYKVVHRNIKGGAGSARKLGMSNADGVVIAWLDGDGTYDPASLLLLLPQLEAADQVIGARHTDHGRLKWLRLTTKRLSFLAASILWLRWIPDLNSGLRVFRRECLLQWVDQLPDGFSCTSTATLAALNCNQRVLFNSIPYRCRVGNAASKFHPVFDTMKLWKTILRLRFQRNSRGRFTNTGNRFLR